MGITREMLEGVMRRRGEEGEKILQIVALGKGPKPGQQELLPRYEAAREVAWQYESLIGKGTITSYFGYFRLMWKASAFLEKFDLPEEREG